MTDQAPLTSVLRATARNADKLLTSALAPLELTGTKFELLAAYAENPGSSNSEAARACDINEQSAHTITTALAGKGWITIDAPVRLRRAVYVTEPGLEILIAAEGATRPLEKRLATLLGAAGIRRLRDTADALSAEVNAGSEKEPEEDLRFAQVGNAATGLYYRALMWADARKVHSVPAVLVRKWSPNSSSAARLVDAGLWKPDGNDAYRIR